MVLKSIFKSKEQKEKDKKKKALQKQISAIGTGGGRSKQATKKRLQRNLTNINKQPKKKETVTVKGAQANKRKDYGNDKTVDKSTTKVSRKGVTNMRNFIKKDGKLYSKKSRAGKELMKKLKIRR